MKSVLILLVLAVLGASLVLLFDPFGDGASRVARDNGNDGSALLDLAPREKSGLEDRVQDVHTPAAARTEFENKEETTAAAPMRPDAPGDLRFKVADAEGSAISDARATLIYLDDEIESLVIRLEADPEDLQGEVGASAEANSQGHVQLRNIEPGRRLRLIVEGRYWAKRLFLIAPLAAGESRNLKTITLQKGVVLAGRVLGPEGHPLPGVRVSLLEGVKRNMSFSLSLGQSDSALTTVTDEDGGYLFQGVPPGTYSCRAETVGYSALEQTHEIQLQPAEQRLDLQLSLGRPVTGQVVNADGTPLSDARVVAIQSGTNSNLRWTRKNILRDGAKVDEHAGFTIGGLDGGQAYVLFATAPGYGIGRSQRIGAGDHVQLSLNPVADLHGKVMQQQNMPVANAAVEVFSKDKDNFWAFASLKQAHTDEQGDFVISDLEPGAYELVASSKTGFVHWDELQIEKGRDPIEVKLLELPAVTVMVADSEGTPLAGVDVTLKRASSEFPYHFPGNEESSEQRIPNGKAGRHQGVTNQTGEVSFYGVVAGTWRVMANPPKHADVEVEFERDPEKPQRVELISPQAATLQIQVLDILGNPVSNAGVGLAADDGRVPPPTQRKTDEWGLVTWTDLTPGSYRYAYRQDSNQRAVFMASFHQEEESALSEEEGEPLQLQPGEFARKDLILSSQALLRVQVTRFGQPVAGAKVKLKEKSSRNENWGWADFNHDGGHSYTTDAEGWVDLPPRDPGAYVLSAQSSPRFPSTEKELSLVSGKQEVELALSTGRIVGTVISASGPVNGAVVELTQIKEGQSQAVQGVMVMVHTAGTGGEPEFQTIESGGAKNSSTTRPDGTFVIEDVPANKYVVKIKARGFTEWKSEPIEHDGTEEYSLGTIEVLEAGGIKGFISGLSSESSLESGVFNISTIDLIDAEGNRAERKVVYGEGRYQFENVKPGKYHLEIEIDDETYKSGDVEVSPGKITDFNYEIVR